LDLGKVGLFTGLAQPLEEQPVTRGARRSVSLFQQARCRSGLSPFIRLATAERQARSGQVAGDGLYRWPHGDSWRVAEPPL